MNTLYIGWFIVHIKGSQLRISKLRCISVPKNSLYLGNSTDTDEMLHSAAFHLENAAFYLGLHCLAKNVSRGFQYTKELGTS